MHKAIGTVVMRAKSEGISKGLLLVCKRARFGVQKDSFCKTYAIFYSHRIRISHTAMM